MFASYSEQIVKADTSPIDFKETAIQINDWSVQEVDDTPKLKSNDHTRCSRNS